MKFKDYFINEASTKTIDINWTGDRQDIANAKKKFNVSIKPNKYGADISGKPDDIKAYLFSDDYQIDKDDFEDLYKDELYEARKMPVDVQWSDDAEDIEDIKDDFNLDVKPQRGTDMVAIVGMPKDIRKYLSTVVGLNNKAIEE